MILAIRLEILSEIGLERLSKNRLCNCDDRYGTIVLMDLMQFLFVVNYVVAFTLAIVFGKIQRASLDHQGPGGLTEPSHIQWFCLSRLWTPVVDHIDRNFLEGPRACISIVPTRES